MKDVEINIVNATELKPGAKYIIGINKRYLSEEDVYKLGKRLDALGIHNAIGVLSDNPDEAIKIIEQKED